MFFFFSPIPSCHYLPVETGIIYIVCTFLAGSFKPHLLQPSAHTGDSGSTTLPCWCRLPAVCTPMPNYPSNASLFQTCRSQAKAHWSATGMTASYSEYIKSTTPTSHWSEAELTCHTWQWFWPTFFKEKNMSNYNPKRIERVCCLCKFWADIYTIFKYIYISQMQHNHNGGCAEAFEGVA